MSRVPRIESPTRYQHLIVRGNGKQILFEEDGDYHYYLSLLQRLCNECDITLCAYCLMENHVHLLVNGNGQNVSTFMKRIGTSYAIYFNKKYQRVGHVFQGRYLSEPIKNESHLLVVLRYILKNPQKAGICPLSAYKWSSYALYGVENSIVDTSGIRNILGDVSAYRAFMNAAEEDDAGHILDYNGPQKKDDAWALSVIQNCLGGENISHLRTLGKAERNNYLRMFRNKGLTFRQIERLTGISRGIVERACKKSDNI